MGLFEKLFGSNKTPQNVKETFQTLTAYQPTWRKWGGEIYESELVRASIDAIARNISKLDVTVQGTARPYLQNRLKLAPNEFQTWQSFLYRLATITYIQNTAFIAPVYGEYGEITGCFPILPIDSKLVQKDGREFIRFEFKNGKVETFPYEEVGIITRFQYRSDIYGEKNNALHPTMQLMSIQNQGIEEGIKSSASFRFFASMDNFADPEDIYNEQVRFAEKNIKKGKEFLLFPNWYRNVTQINSKPYSADAEQMKLIQTSVYNYFGVNEDILQNKAYGDSWNSFYEGCIEPFAVMLGEILTKMFFSTREISQGTKVFVSSNRIQYMSNADKLNVSSQLLDRGIMSINDVRQIWNLPPVEDGDTRIIRGEYYSADEKLEAQNEE